MPQAEKVGTVVPHNDAVPAPCPHYAQGCGGCAMQDLAYAAQLKAKQRQVRRVHAHPSLQYRESTQLVPHAWQYTTHHLVSLAA